MTPGNTVMEMPKGTALRLRAGARNHFSDKGIRDGQRYRDRRAGFGDRLERQRVADVVAFEGNKRLRGPLDRKPRRAWVALDNANGEARVRIKYLNRENIDWVMQRLEDVRAHNAGLVTGVPQILAELPSLERLP